MKLDEMYERWLKEQQREEERKLEAAKATFEGEMRAESQEVFARRSLEQARLYNILVEVFGEETPRQIRWRSGVPHPITNEGTVDVAELDDMAFFFYGGTLCILDGKRVERIFGTVNLDSVFAARKGLKERRMRKTDPAV